MRECFRSGLGERRQNAQAGDTIVDKPHHGGPDQALYAYAREDLADWERTLDRSIRGGFFGENLTTVGVEVTGALVGEVWRVGTVLLQVTSPRIPCATRIPSWPSSASSAPLSPADPIEPWAAVGRAWAQHATLRKLQQLYPNPPLVLFISNNEYPKRSTDDLHMPFTPDADGGLVSRRRALGDAWIARYRALQNAFRENLESPAWRRNALFVGYDAFSMPAMGRWGGTVVTRGRWDPAGFAAQTPQFVTGVVHGFVQFGYSGQRTGDARADIRVKDVAWLCRYLGRITDAQLRAALTASGATPEETDSFTSSLRNRIEQLRGVG